MSGGKQGRTVVYEESGRNETVNAPCPPPHRRHREPQEECDDLTSTEDASGWLEDSMFPEEMKTLNSNYSFMMSGLKWSKTLNKSRVEEGHSIFVLKSGHLQKQVGRVQLSGRGWKHQQGQG